MRLSWLWPLLIIFSALAAGFVTFVIPVTALRPVIVLWFLLICPGMALVRFMPPLASVVEWTLALALSFAIDSIVAGIQLYAGKWSPAATLLILIVISIAAALVQFTTLPRFSKKRE
jgi:hypothetical protein